MVAVFSGVNEFEYEKVPFSDVVITRKRNLLWGRKWRAANIKMVIIVFAIHLLALFAPFAYVLCELFGIMLSYHRNLTHHSFKLPKWLEYIFAYVGLLAFQGDPIFWVSTHRYHHQYVDTEKDPHSPTNGFWFSHMGWLFDGGSVIEKYQDRKNVEDLKSQKFYRFLNRTHGFHVYSFTALVYAFGGFTYLVWVVGVSTVCIYHATFFVNSVCHIWGNQTWDTGDLSKNNWWMALITFGDGWHNNHHAFEYSARHGLEWWQVDFVWYVIRFLEALGLATNVKLPTEAQKLKKSFAASE
ncbi:Fatty acid desaturase, type 1 [Cynara cardunculus var. scolymus]|uniref:Fatty acid desaturase, type 1 n=1 Tax=Cynara cardunculus var. scolymus TaxID=59895 RepID=A0A103XW51_CYNCS|nr:Fatty acid desaturase, type 1 [Cynara cardunculus var. scolymus]